MSEIESDFGIEDYCARCLSTIHVHDFRDNVAISTYKRYGMCQQCQNIMEDEGAIE